MEETAAQPELSLPADPGRALLQTPSTGAGPPLRPLQPACNPSQAAFPHRAALFVLEASLPPILEFNLYHTTAGQVEEPSLSRGGN